MEFLASDELEGRDTPSKGLAAAAKYIATSFSEFGLKSLPGLERFYQPVKMITSQQPNEIHVKINDLEMSEQSNLLHISGQNQLTRANWVMMDSNNQDYKGLDLKNKIVMYIVDRDDSLNPGQIIRQSRKVKEVALEREAVGIIEIFKESNRYWDRFNRFYSRSKIGLDLSGNAESDLLHLFLRDIDGKLQSSLEKSTPGEISVDIAGWNKTKFITYNVIGLVEGTDPALKNEYIICTAHYDHIGIGRPDASGDSINNGARDNAIGVMSVMMAAENIADHPLKRPVLFVLFTGEEKGLLGSKWFVKNQAIPLKDMVFCLNTDGGGYNDTTIATVIGERRINSLNIFEKACSENGISAFEGTDDTQFLFNNSDNIIFSQKGIPSVTFSVGLRDMDAEIMKYYHQPSDEVESLNFDYILKYSKSFGLSLRMIADSKDRLFWVEEDEFFDLGKQLYK